MEGLKRRNLKHPEKPVSAIDRYELLRLFSVSGNKVVAILSAIRQRLFSVQHAVLKRNHHLIQLAKQRHQLGNAQPFRIGADWAAGNAVVTGTLMRLTHKVHLEGGRVFRFLFRRIPLGVFDNALLFSALPLSVFKSVFAKYHLI